MVLRRKKVSFLMDMVAVGKRNSDEDEFVPFCGGTLISHTWIGTNRLTDQKGVIIAIKHAIRHPGYKPPAMYADIGLIELMNPITFNTFIRPACLYQQYDTVPRKAWITGWQASLDDVYVFNERLLKTQLDVIDNLYCSVEYNDFEFPIFMVLQRV
ncbi:PREDICTED: serine protease 27-like [Trachymyrmex septentrionalis]|uniref:serine protease 27-like n=1 Tax=Trachymyrmex septentrionalis TaxID=34720 RepID=UPI00084F1F5A|nr:PREDICTED: serine protease 27-like [Trachymyrmex septentrionalis]